MTTDTPTPEPTGRRSRIGTKTALGAAGAVAAVAAGFGISAAVADTPSPSGSASGSSSASPSGSATTAPGAGGGGMGMRHGGPDGFGRGPGHGPGMGGFGMGRGLDTAALATKLGVTEDKLTAALQKVGQSMRDQHEQAEDGTRTPPTQAEIDARQQAFAAALAKELGIDQTKVTAAFDALRAEREAARKAELSTRLDAAVKSGKLTDADKQSILKGFDAGVLGGPQRD